MATLSGTILSSSFAVRVICLLMAKLLGVISIEAGLTEIADGLLLVIVTV